ncbi:MAG: hypothetical protein ACYSWO_29280 [Planctomycetota bacterium]
MFDNEIPYVQPWWTKAYNWFRKWGWVPLGFVLLLLSFIFGGALFNRRDGKIVSPLDDIREKVVENNREIDIDIERARQAHIDEVQRIEREHAAALEQLNEDQERRRQQLRRNPKKLAKWLTRLAQNEQDSATWPK